MSFLYLYNQASVKPFNHQKKVMLIHLKKFFVLFFVLSLFSGASIAQSTEKKQEGINWMSFHDAVNKNQKEQKKIFIDFYTSWCGWCKRMDATTFEDPAIVAYMNKNFYAIKFNAETHDTIVLNNKSYVFRNEYRANELAAQMLNGSMSYPTSVYLDENFNEIGPVPGYLTAEQLLPVLKYFSEDIYKTKKWDDYINETIKK
jgi:thioredoxin-related protein